MRIGDGFNDWVNSFKIMCASKFGTISNSKVNNPSEKYRVAKSEKYYKIVIYLNCIMLTALINGSDQCDCAQITLLNQPIQGN